MGELQVHQVAQLLYLNLSNGETLETTPNHPFYVRGDYKEAGFLEVGDTLFTATNDIITIQNLYLKDTLVTVYNFSVAENTNYFVGNFGVLVHNTCLAQLLSKYSNLTKKLDGVSDVLKNEFLTDFGKAGDDVLKILDDEQGFEAWEVSAKNEFPETWRTDVDFLSKLKNVWNYNFVNGNVANIPNIELVATQLYKVTDDVLEQMRNTFNSSVRKSFLESLSNNPKINEMLKKAGFSVNEIPNLIQRLREGNVIPGYQVHHKIPLDLGGSNAFENLILIKQTPYHSAITSYHNSIIKPIVTNTPQSINFPSVKGNFYSPPYIE